MAVRCCTTADVVTALAFARLAGLEVSVHGGGHTAAGRAVTDVATTALAPLGVRARAFASYDPSPWTARYIAAISSA